VCVCVCMCMCACVHVCVCVLAMNSMKPADSTDLAEEGVGGLGGCLRV